MRKGIPTNLLASLLFIAAFTGGCYYDNEERLYPDKTIVCDTIGVTFTGTVWPIMQNSCLLCHNATDYAAAGGGLNFEDFSMVKAVAVSGMLLGAVTHTPPHSPMPKNRPKLDSCSISKIKKWIDDGAMRN